MIDFSLLEKLIETKVILIFVQHLFNQRKCSKIISVKELKRCWTSSWAVISNDSGPAKRQQAPITLVQTKKNIRHNKITNCVSQFKKIFSKLLLLQPALRSLKLSVPLSRLGYIRLSLKHLKNIFINQFVICFK